MVRSTCSFLLRVTAQMIRTINGLLNQLHKLLRMSIVARNVLKHSIDLPV